jgi:hypothetical protein
MSAPNPGGALVAVAMIGAVVAAVRWDYRRSTPDGRWLRAVRLAIGGASLAAGVGLLALLAAGVLGVATLALGPVLGPLVGGWLAFCAVVVVVTLAAAA